MPCPFFEPRRLAGNPRHPGARLPLFDEYEGFCQAGTAPVIAPEAVRFEHCNRGYSRGCCDRFPPGELRSGLRYDIVERSAAALLVLCIEEQDYTPLRWHSVRYFLEGERLEPEPPDGCVRAQLLAFCRGYLRRPSV